MSTKPWGRLFMSCTDGRPHVWDMTSGRYDVRCTACDHWKSDLHHYHGYVCEWEWKDEGGLCDFVRERAARLATKATRDTARWAVLLEADRRAEARRKERQERWRQVAAEYESQRMARQERTHQRRRLREGHQTLTAIRRLLRGPGVRSSLVLASGPATTSPI